MDAAPNDSPLTCGAFVTFMAVEPALFFGFMAGLYMSLITQLINLRRSVA